MTKQYIKEPTIKAYEHSVSIDNGKKTKDITKTLNNNMMTTTDNIQKKTIRQKVHFPKDLISPKKGAKTSKIRSYPKSILRKGIHGTKKKLKKIYRIINPK